MIISSEGLSCQIQSNVYTILSMITFSEVQNVNRLLNSVPDEVHVVAELRLLMEIASTAELL